MNLFKTLIVLLIATSLMNCSGEEAYFNCFGASSPIDLTLKNNDDKDHVLAFYYYSEKEGYNRMGTLRMDAMSQKTICIENEGPIEKGLYIYDGNKTFKIKLKWAENFILNLKDSTHLITTPSEFKN